jgi:hypothetical protein
MSETPHFPAARSLIELPARAPQLRIVAADTDPHLPPVLAKLQIGLDLVSGVDFAVLRLLGSNTPTP